MRKSKSIRLSDMDSETWGVIQRSAGLSLRPYPGELSDLKLQTASLYEWGSNQNSSEASKCLAHIRSHLEGAVDEKRWCMYNARQHRNLLTVSGMHDELGFNLKGTADAALIDQHSMHAGLHSNGLRWLWLFKPAWEAPTANTSGGSSSTPDSQGEYDIRVAYRAMATLLLANIHAPHYMPMVTVTDLRDKHSILWLDGSQILYHTPQDAATAWTLTRALLGQDPRHSTSQTHAESVPECLQPVAKRRKLEMSKDRSNRADLAELAAQSDTISGAELRRRTAICLLKQLFHLPAFSLQARQAE